MRIVCQAVKSWCFRVFVVVIDDEPEILFGLNTLLTNAGCHVVCASSGSAAIESLGNHQRDPDLIISDYKLAGNETGFDVIHRIRNERNFDIPAVLFTGMTRSLPKKIIDEAATHGWVIIPKSLADRELLRRIGNVLSAKHGSKADESVAQV